MAAETWTPEYEHWRHGGWYVTNVRYPSGAIGCVSNNYADKRWRIVCQETDPEVTFASRDAAARAEKVLADYQLSKAPPCATCKKPCDPQDDGRCWNCTVMSKLKQEADIE